MTPASAQNLTGPTQNELALAAGVSRSTVSRALKHDSSISRATRERIARLAQKMGYCENPFITANMQRVRRLHHTRSKAIIAFLMHCPLEDWYREVKSYHEFYVGARRQASLLGYELDPIAMPARDFSPQRCNGILAARGVDGIILAPDGKPMARRQLHWSRFSVASLSFAYIRPRFSYSSSNYYFNMCLACRRLHRLGYKRPGMAMPGRADYYTQGMFQAAYLLYAHKYMGGSFPPPLRPKTLPEWNREVFLAWFRQYRPDVIICVTRDVKEWLRSDGVEIPRDVGLAVLCHHKGDLEWSGIEQHAELVGEAAVQIVAEQLMADQRGHPDFPRTMLIEGEWIDGGTTRRMH